MVVSVRVFIALGVASASQSCSLAEDALDLFSLYNVNVTADDVTNKIAECQEPVAHRDLSFSFQCVQANFLGAKVLDLAFYKDRSPANLKRGYSKTGNRAQELYYFTQRIKIDMNALALPHTTEEAAKQAAKQSKDELFTLIQTPMEMAKVVGVYEDLSKQLTKDEKRLREDANKCELGKSEGELDPRKTDQAAACNKTVDNLRYLIGQREWIKVYLPAMQQHLKQLSAKAKPAEKADAIAPNVADAHKPSEPFLPSQKSSSATENASSTVENEDYSTFTKVCMGLLVLGPVVGGVVYVLSKKKEEHKPTDGQSDTEEESED